MTRRDAPDADWAAVRRDYEALAEPIGVICARHRIGRAQLAARRIAEGWTPRPRAGPALGELRALQAAHRRAERARAALAGARRTIPWPDVRHDYEETDAPIAAICERYDITGSQLAHRRRQEGWLPRAPGPVRTADYPFETRRALLRRLTGIVATQVDRLEERMAEKDGMASGEDARLAEQAAATLHRLDRMVARAKRKKAARTDETDDGTDWRALLKQRLDRLHGQGDAG